MRKVLLGTAIAASLITCVAKISVAQQKIIYSAPQIRLPLMQTPPVIDGTIHDNEWSGADRMERFGRSAPLSPQQASFWVGGDAQNLYIAVRTETPPNGQILQRANPLPGDTDARPFDDDSIEIYLCPNPTAPAAKQLVYQGIFNAKSAIYDQLFTASGGQAWRGDWQIKNSVDGDHWDCEIALPWKDVGIIGSPSGKTMALRIGRDWKRSIGSVQTEWSPMGGDYLAESTMARVTWDANAPVVQVLQLQDAPDQSANIDLQITNPTSAAVKVLSQVNLFPQGSEPTQNKETLAVAAGASQKVHVHSPALNDEPITTDIEVAAPDGKTIYYKRNFSWKINRPDTIWNLDTDAAKRIDTQFAYFPSFNAMHVLVDIANLQQSKEVKSIHLSIRKKGATQNIVQTTMPPLKNNSSELRRWDVPALDAGDYELVTQLQGVDVKPQVQPFTRQHFAWEGNKLGLSDIVVPPFTPIGVKGNEIDTVLRQHQINGVGLWNQVVADGDPLLKAPMRLEATINGKVLSAQGNVKVLSHKATQVVTNATWQAGALKGWYWKKMLTTFDDGIYWDNTFLVSNFNPITSDAFVLPDGQVQPSAALWDKRALVRRGAVLADELGKPNRNMVHMTDGAIAPILSFATSQLGWENHAGDSDFQDRFSRDYIQTVNIGRQFGNDPIVLTVNQIRTSDVQKKNWINRTAAGVMLTHEIKPLLRQYPTDPFFENYDRLVNFGYGQPGVTVYNYWDKSTFPAQVSGDTSSIIASKPGHAMMVICDWGGGGNMQVKLDTKVLSLNGALKVTNAETGEPLTVSGNMISFTLKKHDFEVIQIDAQ